jgi:very-short-patch-repair endonuclease
MHEKTRTHQRALELAAARHWVLSRKQLLLAGYSKAGIEAAVASGRLHPVHREAFAVGHPGLSDHGRCLAAVITRGDHALLSYGSAAWLWGLLPTRHPPIEVSVPWRGHGRNPLHLHHCPALRPEDRASHEGIPVTAVPRTLLDVASTDVARTLEFALDRADRQDLLDLASIYALLEEVRGHRGRGRLKRALALYDNPVFARSGGERRLLRLLQDAGLPRPAMNTFVEGYEIDLYWQAERFAIELDGWDAHRTRTAFEDDRKRQEDLKLAGIEMIRVTGRRMVREPDDVANRVAALLRRRREELLRLESQLER